MNLHQYLFILSKPRNISKGILHKSFWRKQTQLCIAENLLTTNNFMVSHREFITATIFMVSQRELIYCSNHFYGISQRILYRNHFHDIMVSGRKIITTIIFIVSHREFIAATIFMVSWYLAEKLLQLFS